MASLSRWLREPLVSFFAIGLVLFAIDRAIPTSDPAHEITLDAAFVRGLEEEATRRTGHVPDDAQREALVDAFLREEVLYREARALGLDQDDLVVRRRLVQKIELLLAAEARWDAPTEGELAAYLSAHAETYRRERRSTVSLCFFSRELGNAEARAAAALASPDEMHCDPHLPGDHFEARTDAQLAATVGVSFAAALEAAPVGAWSGPVETSRGLYLFQIEERAPARDAELDEVRSAVLGALVESRRAAVVHAREVELSAAYIVDRTP